NPETPTTRSPAPSRYSVSTVSSVRQTTRLGQGGAAVRSASSITRRGCPRTMPEVERRGTAPVRWPGVADSGRERRRRLGNAGHLLPGERHAPGTLLPGELERGHDPGQLCQRAHLDLPEDGPPMRLHRALGDPQLRADLLVEPAADERAENGALAGGEP